MNKHIGISYGVLSPEIKVQLNEQKFNFNESKINCFERQRDAVNTLLFAGLISDSVKDNILKKLHMKICTHVAKENGLIIKK